MADQPKTDAPSEARAYRPTVFLPETSFPMRAGLPKLEPAILERWREAGLYDAVRARRQADGAPLFVLHDGPPYANGDIHIGHALNKILKDFVVRTRFALGHDVDYVPGWDCHGLPIEWKIEEGFRAKGRRKDEIPAAEFRAACRVYADDWMAKQSVEFQRLGVLGDWAHRYATMDFTSEAAIVREFHRFVMSGQVRRAGKPVMWSPVERTALADAEVEYAPHVSPTIWVKFPVVAPGIAEQRLSVVGAERTPEDDALTGASVVIWTTTPWTIPGNRAVAYGPQIAYGVYTVEAMEADPPFAPWAAAGDRLIVADKLADEVRQAAKIATWTRTGDVDPSGLVCEHPLASVDPGYRYPVPLLAGDHVTDDAGTGFVHTAPSHGVEDWQVWLASGRTDVPDMVDPDGAYYDHVPLFGGLKVLETEGKKAGRFGPANDQVMTRLIEAGNLLARGRLEHSYPMSWRSKAPVIYRSTPQWFIRLDEPLNGGATLRELALAAIDATQFTPPGGINRIRSMVESRPDWLISRQRAWGTPLAIFVDAETGEPLRDEAVNARIQDLIAEEGADAWFTRPASDFLGDLDPERYEKIDDILDVWFDSGSTHAFTLEGRNDSAWPADLYLEGSDQHRGWFQSSLLESCGTRGRAPYKAVLTHGFTLDEAGEKMSKSRGNTTAPQDVLRDSGADILRLWTALVDYAEDQRIGKTILQTTADAFRKLRNTLRYLLGALAGFEDAERVALDQMPPLERFILHRLWELDGEVRRAWEAYDFQGAVRAVSDFCSGDLSALYFDVRKDALYCDRPDSERRRAARTVMDAVFERLTVWLSPTLSFTCEEAWTLRFPEGGSNVMRVLPETPEAWRNDEEAARWKVVLDVRSIATGELEIARRDKLIGSSLEAALTLHIGRTAGGGNDEYMNFYASQGVEPWSEFRGLDVAEIMIVSQADLSLDPPPAGVHFASPHFMISARVAEAEGAKCQRCWRVLPEVTADLCVRCEDAVTEWDARHAH